MLKEVRDAFFYTYMEKGDREPDLPRGRTGFDAPTNVGIFVLGWLFGGDDFGKSICVACGCGEDTDCTAATLGATLGIIYGIDGIPEAWKQPIGNKIVTVSLNRADLGHIFPNTVQELTERVIRLAPRFIDDAYVDLVNAQNGYSLLLNEGEALRNKPHECARAFSARSRRMYWAGSPLWCATRPRSTLFGCSTVRNRWLKGEPIAIASSLKTSCANPNG